MSAKQGKPKPDPELTERCRRIAEEALPCSCVIEAEVMQVNPPDIFAGIHFAGCWTAKVPHLAGFIERELLAERVKVRREFAEEAIAIFIDKYCERDSPTVGVACGVNAIRALAETGERDGG